MRSKLSGSKSKNRGKVELNGGLRDLLRESDLPGGHSASW